MRLGHEARRALRFSYPSLQVKVFDKATNCQNEQKLDSPEGLLKHKLLGPLPKFQAWQGDGSRNCIYSLLTRDFKADNPGITS